MNTVKAQYKEKKNLSTFAIAGLMLMAGTITVLGLGFGVYALINNISFTVMRSQIPGAVFAAVVAFLGIRYLIATIKLARKIRGREFAWRNFRKTVTVPQKGKAVGA